MTQPFSPREIYLLYKSAVPDLAVDRKPPDGWLRVRCPLHDGNGDNFSISLKTGNYTCHSRCGGGSILDFVERFFGLATKGEAYEKACDIVGREDPKLASKHGKSVYGPILAEYIYRSAEGNVAFRVTRHEPGHFNADTGEWERKTFRQWQPTTDPRRPWLGSVKGVRLVPYHLPALLAADKECRVWIVEGERDVHTLEAQGETATTNPMGAGKWRPEFATYLQGFRAVIIVADNDDPGHKHADDVARSLIGVVEHIGVMTLQGHVPEHGDITDFLAASTWETLESLVAKVPEYVPLEHAAPATLSPARSVVWPEDFSSPPERDSAANKAPAESDYADLTIGEYIEQSGGLAEMYVKRPNIPPDFLCPWNGVNQVVRVQRGDLIVIAARPNMGKTANSLQIGAHNAHVLQRSGLFVSLEMPKRKIFDRLIAHATQTDYGLIQRREMRITSPEYREMEQRIKEYHSIPFRVIDAHDLGSTELGCVTKMLRNRRIARQIDFAMIDPLHYLPKPMRNRSRNDEVANAVRDVKKLAVELNIVVILLCQLNREAARGKRRPEMQDVRESGEIEQVADVILGLHRDSYYESAEKPPPLDDAEIIVLKNRDGETGRRVKLVFQGRLQTFTEVNGDIETE